MPTNAPVAAAHIRLDARGMAWIDDTNTKVIEVALDHLAHGWSPEEIHSQHPHLSLGQIHAALAYYHDNREALDSGIQARLREHRSRRAEAVDSPIRKRLRGLGKLCAFRRSRTPIPIESGQLFRFISDRDRSEATLWVES